MSTSHLERATARDLSQVLILLDESGLPDAGLREHLATLLVARQGGRVVGSAALELYGSSALLRSIAVHASVRRTGLGQRLTRGALDLAREKGVREVYLLTETAVNFFNRFGFKPVERSVVPPAVQTSVEFTTACPESATVMDLDLVPRIA